MTDAALELHDISKRFGGVVALDRASLVLRPGTVHALLGENGAGKTTLMRVAFGMQHPDAGTVRVRGRAVRFDRPADAIAAGIGMVHQHFTIVPRMTVAENVALGGTGRFDPARTAERIRRIVQETGLALDPGARADELTVAAQQRLEIVKALDRSAAILVLDEPTAVLAPAEADELLRWTRRYADAGNAVVLITHKLREARRVADDVTVLRHGRTALSSRASDADDDALVRAMLGETPAAPADDVHAAAGDVVIALHDARYVDERGVVRVEGATLDVRAGEIVGVAGVEGSGQRELLRLLAGRLAPTRGRATVPARVGFVPEDRHRDALALEMTLAENVAMSGLGARGGVMPWAEIRRRTSVLRERYDVRGGSTDAPARELSGGNQQKLVLARELDGDVPAVVVENPTRGLDLRAAAAVLDRLRAARRRGAAVVFHSSDLDEVVALADRVIAVHARRIREVTADRDAVGRAMLGLP